MNFHIPIKIRSLPGVEEALTKIIFFIVKGFLISFVIFAFLSVLGKMNTASIILTAIFSCILELFYLCFVISLLAVTVTKIIIIVRYIIAKNWIFATKNFFEIMLSLIALILIILPIISIIEPNLLSNGSRSKARDAKRIADMSQLISAQEFYFKTNGSFFASTEIPKEMPYYSTMAAKTEIFKIPLDPGGGNVIFCDRENPAFIYCAIDNTADSARFCYFARLENEKKIDNKKLQYFVATQGGWNYIERVPKTLDDCDSALKIEK